MRNRKFSQQPLLQHQRFRTCGRPCGKPRRGGTVPEGTWTHFLRDRARGSQRDFDAAIGAVDHAVAARQDGGMEDIRQVSKLEDRVDTLEEEMRDKHIERLSKNECNPSAGVVFLDILSNLERISDHAYNVAGYVKDEL